MRTIGQVLIPLAVGVVLFRVGQGIDILPLWGAIVISMVATIGSGLIWHNMTQDWNRKSNNVRKEEQP